MKESPSQQPVDLNWNAQALWVQDRTMLLLMDGEDPTSETVALQDQVGRQITMSRSELEKTHTPVHHATVYKTKYAPVQAFCPREDSLLRLSDTEYSVPAGDALVRDQEGNVSLIPRHEFNCRYQFVAAAGADVPFT